MPVDDEGAARVFRFMDGMSDLYASFLDDRAASDLRGHPLGKVREVLASESLWRLSLNGNLGPQFRFVVRAIESRVKGRCTCRSAINLQNEFRMEARRAESR